LKLENSGKSLRIRAVEPDDADWLAATWANREFVSLYCSNIQSSSAGSVREALLARQHTPSEVLGFIEFIIERLDGQRIGVGSLGNYAAQHRRAEFMIGIVDTGHRRGMAGLEATLLLLELAFNHYALNKLFSYVYAYNDYSEDYTVKLGAVQEGRLRQHHWLEEEGRFIDLYINGLTQEDFRHSPQLARWSRRLIGRDITTAPVVLPVREQQPLTAEVQSNLLDALASRRPAPASR
jgi:ribosomal-protein-alanine N-acetyltransferase